MNSTNVREAHQAAILLEAYSFELIGQVPIEQVAQWQQTYPAPWIRDAVIEALYQGRYKVVSVDKILRLWRRRAQPVRHFTAEFKQTIGLQLGSPMGLSLPLAPSAVPSPPEIEPPDEVGQRVYSAPQAAIRIGSESAPPAPRADSVELAPKTPRRRYRSVVSAVFDTGRPIQPFRPALPVLS